MARAIDWTHNDQLKAQGLGDREIARPWEIPWSTFHREKQRYTQDHSGTPEHTMSSCYTVHPSTPRLPSKRSTTVHPGTPAEQPTNAMGGNNTELTEPQMYKNDPAGQFGYKKRLKRPHPPPPPRP